MALELLLGDLADPPCRAPWSHPAAQSGPTAPRHLLPLRQAQLCAGRTQGLLGCAGLVLLPAFAPSPARHAPVPREGRGPHGWLCGPQKRLQG